VNADGAALDRATGTWRRLADRPGGGVTGTRHLWTGTEAMSFGAAYDVGADRWRELAGLEEVLVTPGPGSLPASGVASPAGVGAGDLPRGGLGR
jgi:hypothetical protein